jgi:hypothetical protein
METKDTFSGIEINQMIGTRSPEFLYPENVDLRAKYNIALKNLQNEE